MKTTHLDFYDEQIEKANDALRDGHSEHATRFLLNEYRVLKKLTVRDVSKKSGVSVGRVQAALSGDIGSLSLNNAMAICEVLEVNIYDAYKEVFTNG